MTAKQTNVARVIIDPTPVQVVLTDDASDNLTIKTKDWLPANILFISRYSLRKDIV